MFAAPRASAAALALLIATAPLAYAGGSHNGGSRRAPPPQPPPQNQPSSLPPSAPPPMARSGPSQQPSYQPRYQSGGGLNPGRQNLPEAFRGPATPQQGTSSAPMHVRSLPSAGSVPGPLNGGATRFQPPPTYPGTRRVPLPNNPAPTSALSPPPVVRYTPGEWEQRNAAARLRLNQGGVRTGSGGVLPQGGAGPLPSPLQGTAPSSRWDRNRGVLPPSSSYPGNGLAPSSLPAPLARQQTGDGTAFRAGSPAGVGSPGLRRGPLGADGGRSSYDPQSRLLAPPTQAPSLTGAVHVGGVRRSGGGPLPTLGGGGSPVASLPTHTGGVRYGGSSSPSHTGGHRGTYPRPWSGPAWGFAPEPVYSQPYVNEITVVNVWGFAPAPCCPPPQLFEEPVPCPEPVFLAPAEPWPQAPYYQPPTYLVPPSEPGLPAFPPPSPAPLDPAPAGPVEPAAPPADKPVLDEATLKEAFGRMLASFQSGDYDAALAVAEALTQADPKLGEAWMAAAHSLFALGRYGPAAQALTQAALLGAFPRGYRFDPLPLYGAPETFAAQQKALAAQIAAQPADADAHLVLAWLLTSLGRRADAQEQLVQVLTLRPGDQAAPILALALLPAEAAQAPAAAAPPAPTAPSAPASPGPVPGPLPVEER